MLKLKRIWLVGAIVCLSLVMAALGQARRGGARGAAGRGMQPAEPPVLESALLTGTLRFSTGGVNMYLVVGKEKALLIDTGNPGNISPEQIRALTDLPLLVVNTHAHPDHSGCNSRFGTVYIHEADLESGRQYSGGDVELIPIEEGYVFDLGGKTLEVVGVPGHTPGSICLIDAQDKLLFGGDTANEETWAFISNVPLETYKASMERLLKWRDQYDVLLPGHGGTRPISYIEELIACADEILTGKVDPSAQPAETGLTRGSLVHQYRSAKIRYNPNNLREKND
jgi:glyoxylase-like metal-dependent hydrolase (beta-lactamase superfamily II)